MCAAAQFFSIFFQLAADRIRILLAPQTIDTCQMSRDYWQFEVKLGFVTSASSRAIFNILLLFTCMLMPE
jgi:hypothetical protein